MVPMLLATAFMGQALIYIVREREMAFIIFVFSSVIFLFLSGMVWPRYAMSTPWLLCGDIIPGVWGIEGFIRINNNGASLLPTLGAGSAIFCGRRGRHVLSAPTSSTQIQSLLRTAAGTCNKSTPPSTV